MDNTQHKEPEQHPPHPKENQIESVPQTTHPFYHGEQAVPAQQQQQQLLQPPKPSPPKVVITDPTGAPAAVQEDKKKEKKEKKKTDEQANMEENWKLIHEKEKDLNERLKELENQQFALEQARQEKKAIAEEVEAMKREVQSLKKVKEKLFLEVQRIKVPPNAPKIQMQESMIQTEVAPGFENFDQILKKIKHLEGQCEELQEINYTKGQQLKEAQSKVSQLEATQKKEKEMQEAVKQRDFKIKDHQNEIDKLQGMLDEMHKQSSSTKTFTEAQLQAFESNLQAKITYIQTLESQVETQEKEIKTLRDKSVVVEKERNDLKQISTDLTHKLDELTQKLAEKNKNSSSNQLPTGKTPSQIDLSLSKNKNGSQMDKKSDSKINVQDVNSQAIPVHTANFGGKMLNSDSVEDLDDSKKKQNPHEVTFRPEQSNLKNLIDIHPSAPSLSKDAQVADLESQLKLQTTKADNIQEQLTYQRSQLSVKIAECDKLIKDTQKMKGIIDDQMQIAEKQRDKLMQYKETEQNMQAEINKMNKKVTQAEEKERLQTFQIEKLRKQLKKYDKVGEDNKQIKDLQEQVKKMKNENDLLNELIKSLKLQNSAKAKKQGNADFTIQQQNDSYLPEINAKYPQNMLNQDRSRGEIEPGLPSQSVLLHATPQQLKLGQPMIDPSRQHQRSTSVTYNFEEDNEANDSHKLRMKRQQSRERRERLFTDQMDAKMNEYNEKIRNRFMHQSPGVKGIFQTNFNSNYAVSSNAGSQAYVGMPTNSSPAINSDRSNPSRGGSYRSPTILGVKMDRINNRLVINDDKILNLLQTPME